MELEGHRAPLPVLFSNVFMPGRLGFEYLLRVHGGWPIGILVRRLRLLHSASDPVHASGT